MVGSINCRLCNGRGEYLGLYRDRRYYRCTFCFSVMMDPVYYLPPEEEKHRYDQHNNDVNDPGYRQFAAPLVDKIKQNYGPRVAGLDYGAGSGPVASVLLRENGYHSISLYDPYYHPDRSVLSERYHFVICCEVIEHFHQPAEEFKLLRSLLLPGGSLFCMTELYDEKIDFKNWYYKNDPTHVFFYHHRALRWIEKEYNFNSLHLEKRLIQLETPPAVS